MNFKENTQALVLGASSGIGEQVAIELSKKGVQVTLVARSKENLEKNLKKLNGSGHDFFVCDLANKESVKNLCEFLQGQNHIVFINNAGGPKAGPLLEAEEQEFEKYFRIHVLSPTQILQVLVPKMKEAGSGRVVNIISTSVKVPIPNLGVSNTIRGAVASWSKTLSLELGPHNITVNNVLPGYTNTDRLQTLIQNASKRLNKSETEVRALWKSKVPMGRFADPTETAKAVCFLTSAEASYINGVSLPVDGGRTGSL